MTSFDSYFCDADENLPWELLLPMNWYSVDPWSKLLHFVPEEKRGLYIPRSPELIQLIMHELHVVPLGAYSGFMNAYTKTFGSFCAGTRWKNGKVHQDLSSQQVLSKGHLSTTSTHGHPWVSLGIDFPRLDHKLVQKQGYELILVVVWYLSKMDHFIPTRTVADAVKLAELFIEKNILKLKQQGLPKIIISDRDPKFTSKFWKSLFKTLETQLRFSTETDGETDSPQQTLEMMLRRYVKHNLNTWNKNFRILEFAYSSSRHSAMVKSPFSLVY